MVKNTRQDEHFPPGDKYLMQITTDAAGNYQASSVDPKAIGKIIAQVNKDGKYSVEQYDADGNQTHIVSGGAKKSNKSETSTTAEHSDSGVGGGARSNVGKGEHKESGGSSSSASNGPKLDASAESTKTMAPGGDGHHGMKGNQSFAVAEGGIAYDVSKNFSVVAKEAIVITATQDINIKSSTNIQNRTDEKYGINAAQDIMINSDTKITLQCGSSKIEIGPSSVTITSAAVNFVKSG